MTKQKPDLTLEEKNLLAQFLIANSTDGVVHQGKTKEAASLFGVTTRTVYYIWAAAKKQVCQGLPIIFTSNKKGVQKKKTVLFDDEKMKTIKYEERTSIRGLARGLEVSKSNVGRWVKGGVIKPHTNAIKPQLTDNNKLQRVKFSLNALEMDRNTNAIKFSGMYNVVHIDEKWFYMTRTTERYYMVPGEEEPHRSCQSKRYIPKIMFMCAVARPIFGNDGEVIFDGKIGIFPFTQQVPAQRNSKHRLRGTLVTKPIESITKEVTKACLITKIIPAIKARWPINASKNIIIQQDNDKPHISNNDEDFRAAASSYGFNILLVCQPPNSPDTNILDLGWFRAIQSLQLETASYNVDQLVKNVLLSYENLAPMSLNKVFLTLQGCLVEIMKVKGGNNYKIPHMSKERLLREERLPINLQVDEALVRECIQFSIEAGHIESYDIGAFMSDLGH